VGPGNASYTGEMVRLPAPDTPVFDLAGLPGECTSLCSIPASPVTCARLSPSRIKRRSKDNFWSQPHLAGENSGFVDQIAAVIGVGEVVQVVLEPPGVIRRRRKEPLPDPS